MVATSSINHYPRPCIQSRSGGSRAAISAIIAAGSPVGQMYRQAGFTPALSEMQGVSGVDVAGHVASKVVHIASPDSSAYRLATAFISTYPNSRVISPSALPSYQE